MHLLIDGDIIVYRAGFAVQSKKNAMWTEEDEVSYPPVSHALRAAKLMINNILKQCRYDTYQIYLTSDDRSNFRYGIAETKPYKGNRPPEKPIYYHDIRNYLNKYYNAMFVRQQEADDMLGIEQHQRYVTDPNSVAIITIDKDLDMIPGWHFNFVKKKKYYVKEFDALKTFYTQLLTGDSVDNIVGVPNIGPKKADKLLAFATTEEEMLDVVIKAYDYDLDKILENGRLVWIRRQNNELWMSGERKETLIKRLNYLKDQHLESKRRSSKTSSSSSNTSSEKEESK